MIEAEIRRRLVADRGVEAMARTLRKPLPEDVDFMHASREEMQQLQKRDLPAHARARGPARAAPEAPPPRHARLPPDGAPLDVVRRRAGRAEVQAAAAVEARDHGGRRHLAVRSPRSRGSRCSSSTRCRASSRRCGRGCSSTASTRSRGSSTRPTSIGEAIQRVNTEADVVWVDGHSDYGHAFEVWHERHIREVTQKSSIILLGDARNNYHASQAWTLGEMRKRARRLFWLDPEPRGYWDTGDSIVSEYAPYCDGVYECPQPPPAPEVRRRRRRELTFPIVHVCSSRRVGHRCEPRDRCCHRPSPGRGWRRCRRDVPARAENVDDEPGRPPEYARASAPGCRRPRSRPSGRPGWRPTPSRWISPIRTRPPDCSTRSNACSGRCRCSCTTRAAGARTRSCRMSPIGSTAAMKP